MSRRRELYTFMACLALIVGGFFAESLVGGKVLSPADVLFASASFRDVRGSDYVPANRLLIDPVLQFQPWLEFNRTMLRSGRLPLWNSSSGCGAPHLANGQAAVFDPFNAIAYLGRLPEAHGWMAAARLWFARRGDVPPGASLGIWVVGTLVLGAGLPVLRVPGRVAPVPGHQCRRLDALGPASHRMRLESAECPKCRMAGGRGGRHDSGRPRPDECPRPARGRGLFGLARTERRRPGSRWMGLVPGGGAGGGDRGGGGDSAGLLLIAEPGLGRSRPRAQAGLGAGAAPVARCSRDGPAVALRQPATRSAQPGQGARGS